MGKMVDLGVEIAGVKLKNPVMPASGTFAARESGQFYDISKLGAAVTKGVSLVPWPGNPAPRISETYGGMLNSAGLQNPGVEAYIEGELKYLSGFDVPVIANIAGHTIDEYCAVVERLNETSVAMYELNISCPNIALGGITLGTNPKMAALVTERVKLVSKKPVIVKLTPNVTDIAEIARAVEGAGADGVSLINTLLGMRIDLNLRRPVLANRTGGLSGPAIKPIAVRMVYEVRKAVKIPVIGMGGIMNGNDAVEFLMVGANAVAVGTAALINPTAPMEILKQLERFMERQGFFKVEQLHEAFEG